jgi:hypothetical protein
MPSIIIVIVAYFIVMLSVIMLNVVILGVLAPHLSLPHFREMPELVQKDQLVCKDGPGNPY